MRACRALREAQICSPFRSNARQRLRGTHLWSPCSGLLSCHAATASAMRCKSAALRSLEPHQLRKRLNMAARRSLCSLARATWSSRRSSWSRCWSAFALLTSSAKAVPRRADRAPRVLWRRCIPITNAIHPRPSCRRSRAVCSCILISSSARFTSRMASQSTYKRWSFSASSRIELGVPLFEEREPGEPIRQSGESGVLIITARGGIA